MDPLISEIAIQLRSTEQMAEQFAQRIQARIGQPVANAEILAAMKKIPAKSLSMEKVVAKLQQQRKSPSRRTRQRKTAQTPARSTGATKETPASTKSTPAPSASTKKPKTMIERLEVVLQENWDRAEEEGLQPSRMAAEEFVNAVYQFTDRRESTRQRILQAANRLNQSDVILVPALVADKVHELFKG